MPVTAPLYIIDNYCTVFFSASSVFLFFFFSSHFFLFFSSSLFFFFFLCINALCLSYFFVLYFYVELNLFFIVFADLQLNCFTACTRLLAFERDGNFPSILFCEPSEFKQKKNTCKKLFLQNEHNYVFARYVRGISFCLL